MNKNILFVIPDEREVYKDVNVKVGAFHLPSLAFAVLGAIAKKNGLRPVVLDLALYDSPYKELERVVADIDPVYVGLTCTSATYYLALEIARKIKTGHPANAKVLIGGPHVSSVAEETIESGLFDYVFMGEAEKSFDNFLRGIDPKDISGMAFKDQSGKFHISPNANPLKNLDDSPLPDYTLYDLSKYHISRMHARNNPVVWLETSRGCPYDCQVCNKAILGQTFKPKSVERVLYEIEYFLNQGIKEFHIADDGFTSNMKRAEQICDEIIRRKLDLTWSCVNGIRVDRVTYELLKKMRQAGCYRISFGIESGSQRVLDNIGKKITLQQVVSAVGMAKKAGIEVFGFFMFGFEDDTEESMQETISFAKKLPLDLAKASIIIPFPGSPIYYRYKMLGLLQPPEDYRKYNVYMAPRGVYRHPSLDWDVIERYQEKFYRSFYFNPGYIARRFVKSVKTGSLFSDFKAAMTMKWFGKK